MTKPTPLFLIAILTILVTLFSLWVVSAAYFASIDREAEAILMGNRELWEPPTINCPDGDDLWDCIRYENGE